MVGKDKVVMRSIEAPGGLICVDLYRGRDGSWGWAEYRRDPEDGRGWQDSGGAGGTGFADEATALSDALAKVAWLREALNT